MDLINRFTSRELEALGVEVFRRSTSSVEINEWVSKLIECFKIISCLEIRKSN